MPYKKQIIHDQQFWRNDHSRVSTCIQKCETQAQTPAFPVPDTPKSLLTRRWMVYQKKKKNLKKNPPATEKHLITRIRVVYHYS